jgi:hypothetical protein
MFARTLLIYVLMNIVMSHAVFAQESDSSTQRQFWSIVLRGGYSIALKNSFHPVEAGSFAASGGVYARPWELISLGVEYGYQSWRNKTNDDDMDISRRAPDYLMNFSAVFLLHGSSLFHLQRIDPFFMFALGLYDRHFESGSHNDAPGFSYGLGISYMQKKPRDGNGVGYGYGIGVRQHTVLQDDYGVWFAGPSHYWTKTIEVAAEFKLSW